MRTPLLLTLGTAAWLMAGNLAFAEDSGTDMNNSAAPSTGESMTDDDATTHRSDANDTHEWRRNDHDTGRGEGSYGRSNNGASGSSDRGGNSGSSSDSGGGDSGGGDVD